jgi:hypothetical protein
MTLSPTHARRPPPADRPPPAVLVYLSLRPPADPRTGAPADSSAPSPDLPGLARAVERLVHTLAPDVVTRVTVALPAAPPEPDARPRVVPAPPVADGRLKLADGAWLDLGSRTLEVEGRRMPLTRREFELMAYLERQRGVALSRSELKTHVWGSDHLAGDRTIDVHVRRLRVKLGRHHERIATLRGYGYRFD